MMGVRMAIGALLAVFAVAAVAGAGQSPASNAAQGVTVSGRLVDVHPGVTTRPELVLWVRRSGPPGIITGNAPARPDGTFTWENVAPGVYDVWARESFEVRTIEVGTTDLRDVELMVTGVTPLSVTTRVDDGGPVPAGGTRTLDPKPGRFAFGNLQSNAVLALPPGEHWFFVTPPAGTWVRSMSLRGVDVLRNPVVVAPGDPPGVIEVVLTRTRPADRPLVAVAGTAGRPDQQIELIDVTDMGHSRIVGTTTTDEAGRFRFDGLERGVFQVDVPPGARVVPRLPAGAGEVRVDLPIPPDARVFGGAVMLVLQGGQRMSVLARPHWAVVAERDGVEVRLPMEPGNTWAALAPGAYRIRVEGIEPGYTLRSLTAGSVDLLENFFIVPADRPAEMIRGMFDYSGPE